MPSLGLGVVCACNQMKSSPLPVSSGWRDQCALPGPSWAAISQRRGLITLRKKRMPRAICNQLAQRAYVSNRFAHGKWHACAADLRLPEDGACTHGCPQEGFCLSALHWYYQGDSGPARSHPQNFYARLLYLDAYICTWVQPLAHCLSWMGENPNPRSAFSTQFLKWVVPFCSFTALQFHSGCYLFLFPLLALSSLPRLGPHLQACKAVKFHFPQRPLPLLNT